MAGTIALDTTQGWVTYLNTKATEVKELIVVRNNAVEAYVCNSTDIRLPYEFAPKNTVTLPAFESDGTTPTVKTFRFLDAYSLPLTVTYSGNATA